jgi:hypothetical protein
MRREEAQNQIQTVLKLRNSNGDGLIIAMTNANIHALHSHLLGRGLRITSQL